MRQRNRPSGQCRQPSWWKQRKRTYQHTWPIKSSNVQDIGGASPESEVQSETILPPTNPTAAGLGGGEGQREAARAQEEKITKEDVELRWLEEEDERIRERKGKLLEKRGSSTG